MATFLEKRNSRRLYEDSTHGVMAERIFVGGENSYKYWRDAVQIGETFPDEPKVTCNFREVVPIGNLTSSGQYSRCEVIARYKSGQIKYGRPEDRNKEEPVIKNFCNVDFSVEALTVDGVFKYNTSGGASVPYSLTKMIPTAALSFKGRVRIIPFGRIISALGKINSSAITFRGHRFLAYTLLFGGLQSADEVSSEGDIWYDITWRIIYNPVGWNTLFTLSGASLVKNVSYPLLYDSIDFSWLV